MFNLFYDLIFNRLFDSSLPCMDDTVIVFGGHSFAFHEYLSTLLAIICTIIVYVACCLLVVKVIKLFGRLWTRF